MKTLKWIPLLLLTVCVLCLTACTPANFTAKHREEITRLHTPDAEAWFTANMPQAKMTSAKAYATGTDLFAAISGTYKVDGTTYDFLYDYANEAMYLSQNFSDFEEALRKLCIRALCYEGLDVTLYTHSGFGTGIETKTENDNDRRVAEGAEPANDSHTIRTEGLLPAGVTGQEYAERTFAGEPLLYGYSLKVYLQTIPAYDHQLFIDQPGLAYITYVRPIDTTFEGIYEAVYYSTFATLASVSVRPLDTELCGGYLASDKVQYNSETDSLEEAPVYEGDILYENDGAGNIRMEIPPGTTLVLFSKKADYYDCFTDSSGKAAENAFNKMKKNIGQIHFDGYDLFGAAIYLPKSSLEGYSLEYMRKAKDGKYTIKVK